MKLDIEITAQQAIDALLSTIGEDFDTLNEFLEACQSGREVDLTVDVDDREIFEELTNKQIADEYELRDCGDPRNDQDMLNAISALANGERMIARTLFSRAGNEDAARLVL